MMLGIGVCVVGLNKTAQLLGGCAVRFCGGGVRLAEELGENPDALLALAGKVSSDLLEIIRERPFVVAELLRAQRGLAAKFAMAIGEQSGRLFPEPPAGLGSTAYENTP